MRTENDKFDLDGGDAVFVIKDSSTTIMDYISNNLDESELLVNSYERANNFIREMEL